MAKWGDRKPENVWMEEVPTNKNYYHYSAINCLSPETTNGRQVKNKKASTQVAPLFEGVVNSNYINEKFVLE